MQLLKTLSGKVVLLLFVVFAVVFSSKITEVVKDENTCICSYDGFGYYAYLPYLFENQSLAISKEWMQEKQNEHCNGTVAYQVIQHENGADINIYHMGLAFVELPSYLIGDLFARVLGYPTDGFSKPYHIAYLLNALLFIFLGLLYLRKLLLLFFTDRITAITTLVLFITSNIYITFNYQFELQHVFLFAFNATFLYHIIVFTRTEQKKNLWIAAIILGLTVCMRPTQVLMGLIPLILFIKKFGISKVFWKHILIFPLLGILWNIPQILYWYIVGGEPFILNLHSEEIILVDPHISDFLFSYKKGWLLYSPIFLITIIGFIYLYTKERSLFWASLAFSVVYIYIMSSWECWWYAASYGSRVMVDIYPLLAIAIGGALMSLGNSTIKKIIGGLFIVACALLNTLQQYQFKVGYLHYDRMTEQHYWYIFGRLNIPDYTGQHLEIDRNPSEIGWVENAPNLPKEDYSLETKEIYSLEESLVAKIGEEYLTIGRLNILELVPTDETMFDVTIVTKSSDTTKAGTLRMEIVSPYNCYTWRTLEISQDAAQGEYVTHIYKFNLERLRHHDDQMQIYIHKDLDVEIEVKSMTIEATSLVRK
ncbi:MAG: hypothetical protein QNK23_15110 [Crocinitomicaceae bacterium]|nr:hypothetical protein [Crocinitomicaceae bacterium]